MLGKPQQTDTPCGKAAARTAFPQPPKTSQNVPTNSIKNFLFKDRTPSLGRSFILAGVDARFLSMLMSRDEGHVESHGTKSEPERRRPPLPLGCTDLGP